VPRFLGQVDLAVDQAVELRRGVAQRHADHAVVLFPDGAAVLALDAGRLVAFLDEAGLIEGSDALRMAMSARDIGLKDSQWRQWEVISDLYKWCRGRGMYLNVPDGDFLTGSTATMTSRSP
jgi:hypothetical protein